MTLAIYIKRVRRSRGLTLVEMLVVLIIMGLLVGLVGPRVLNYVSGAKSDTAKVQVDRLSTAVELYALSNGGPPTTEQGLEALIAAPSGVTSWTGPYLKGGALPLDPWGNGFLYEMDVQTGQFKISSLGADGLVGGTGENVDIGF